MRRKPKVAFLCVHNSCRSQMAEALGKRLASDVFESCSGVTEPGERINPDAVRDAVINAKKNGVSNVRFYRADAGDFMVKMAQDGGRADVLFMDPPRSGSAEKFLQSAATLAPERIVYISCNPETLGRDLKVLDRLGYQAGKIWPVDMFPWTESCEAVCALDRKRRRP